MLSLFSVKVSQTHDMWCDDYYPTVNGNKIHMKKLTYLCMCSAQILIRIGNRNETNI